MGARPPLIYYPMRLLTAVRADGRPILWCAECGAPLEEVALAFKKANKKQREAGQKYSKTARLEYRCKNGHTVFDQKVTV